MIIVQLKGGLGNQLFQYAAGLSLATLHTVPVKVDVRELQQPDKEIGTFRNYELQSLVYPPAIASESEIEALCRRSILEKYFQKTLPSYQRNIYNEKKFYFDSNFCKAGSNIYLKGYRQSEKYFLPIQKDIQNAFQLKPALVTHVADYAEKLKGINSVAIHIRLGDYANTSVADYHGTLSKKHYQQAIEKITAGIANPSFFIFSDNINWVKQNLHLPQPTEFVSGNISNNHLETFT